MNKIIYFLFIPLVLVSLVGCEEEVVSLNVVDDYSFFINNEPIDTLYISHESQALSFIIKADNKDVPISDWKLFQVAEYDYSQPDYVRPWTLLSMGLKDINSPLNIGWATIQKQTHHGEENFCIEIKSNDTSLKRSFRITVGKKISKSQISAGQIVIVQEAAPDNQPFEIKAKYKGEIYTTMATFDENGDYIYSDRIFEELIETLSAKEDVEMIIFDDEYVCFFDNDDAKTNESIRRLKSSVDSNVQLAIRDVGPLSRASDGFRFCLPSSLGYFAVFDDTGFTDTNYYFNFTDYNQINDQQYLRSIGLNDKISSLVVGYFGSNPEVCSVLTVWEDGYFNTGDNDRTKHRVSFVATYYNTRLSKNNLKNVPCLNSRNSWNDRISSFSFHFGYFGEYLRDY